MWTELLDHRPQIRSVMTPFPHWIDANAPLTKAEAMMREHTVRHLPVLDGDQQIVGVISERDVMRALAGGERTATQSTVIAVCRTQPYVVESHELLSTVLREMADRGLGSALITKESRLAGIFTTTDACQRFAELIDSLFDGSAPRPA